MHQVFETFCEVPAVMHIHILRIFFHYDKCYFFLISSQEYFLPWCYKFLSMSVPCPILLFLPWPTNNNEWHLINTLEAVNCTAVRGKALYNCAELAYQFLKLELIEGSIPVLNALVDRNSHPSPHQIHYRRFSPSTESNLHICYDHNTKHEVLYVTHYQ